MKKVLSIIIITLLFINPFSVLGKEFDIYSSHAILYNLNEDKVLYEKASREKTSIASLTKITTAIVALDNIKDLDSKVTITYEDYKGIYDAGLATAGFQVGEEVTYRDLLYGLLLPSGADAAQALANNISGSNEEFVKLMNKKAKELKLENTHYVNTTGLDDNNHYSTAKDVATVFKYALNNKDFKEIITTSKYTMSNKRFSVNSSISVSIAVNNYDLDYILGGKTGTTGDAGYCLATIAKQNNINYLLVTTNAPLDIKPAKSYVDQKIIYDYYINNYSYHKIIDKKDIVASVKTLYGKDDIVNFYPSKSITAYLKNNYKKSDIKLKYNGKDLITTSMKKGTKIGKVDVYYKNKLLTSINITLKEKQKLDLIKYLKGHILFITLVIPLLIIIYLILTKKKIKIKKYKKVYR